MFSLYIVVGIDEYLNYVIDRAKSTLAATLKIHPLQTRQIILPSSLANHLD